MRGAKPRLDNVTPMRGSPAAENERVMLDRAKAIAKRLRPRGLNPAERTEWNRVAAMLADPRLDRLKPHFVDTVVEYCRACVRLRDLRAFFVDHEKAERLQREANTPMHTALGATVTVNHPLAAEIHVTNGRHGEQLKSHPHVAQMNETWRQWRSLMAELGLSPTAERNMMPGQGSLFDDPAEEFFAGKA